MTKTMILLKLLLLYLSYSKVHCIALKGPPTTWYNPCGLGVFHFDKFSKYNWLGVVHLGLYKPLQEVEIEIHFERKVRIYWASHNSTIIPIDEENHEFIIRPKLVPEQYKFYVEIGGLNENDIDVPTVTKFSINNLILCDNGLRASQTVKALNVNDKHICGRRSLDHSELVSIRTEAKAGEWPWHVAILTKNPVTNETTYYCGGNIISRTAVLTAGYCVRRDDVTIPPEYITVVAGVSSLIDLSQVGRQSPPVTEVVLHPNYDDILAISDLAVIKVNRFNFTAYVQPICIWGPIYDKESLFGRLAMVVGFGENEDSNSSDTLRSMDIMVQNDTTCLAYAPEMYERLINEFTICAGYEPTTGLSPSNGDGGGGLALPVMQTDHKMSWFLRGVLSKCIVAPGQTKCDPKYYLVYTDVGPHYAWIYHHSV